MNRVRNPFRWSRRAAAPLAAGVLVLVAGELRAQPELTAPPFMIKGPTDAPVTIVEFSDYQ